MLNTCQARQTQAEKVMQHILDNMRSSARSLGTQFFHSALQSATFILKLASFLVETTLVAKAASLLTLGFSQASP